MAPVSGGNPRLVTWGALVVVTTVVTAVATGRVSEGALGSVGAAGEIAHDGDSGLVASRWISFIFPNAIL